MESGEIELRKVFEEVTTKNVKTIQEYSTSTRTIVRELENKVKNLQDKLLQQTEEISILRQNLSNIQAKMFRGGTYNEL